MKYLPLACETSFSTFLVVEPAGGMSKSMTITKLLDSATNNIYLFLYILKICEEDSNPKYKNNIHMLGLNVHYNI